MSSKVDNLNKLIVFARANGFPNAECNHWDQDGEPIKDVLDYFAFLSPDTTVKSVTLGLNLNEAITAKTYRCSGSGTITINLYD